MPDTKSEQRQALRAARKALSRDEVTKGSQRIIRTILGTLPLTDFETAALYWPFGNEVDVRGLAAAEESVDLTFCLPIVEARGKPLTFRTWKPGDPVEPGVYGESIPVGGDQVLPQLLFVPLVGFDRAGNRLGQGGGYYDQTLAMLRSRGEIVAVGVAFCVQECLNIDPEDHDEPLDRIVTEQETIIF